MTPVDKVAAPKKPQVGGWPLRKDWQDKLIGYLERYGTYAKACRHAGVSDETVRRYRQADPAFDRRCHEAREIHADTCEEKLEAQSDETGNPVGYIVRLKALRPAQYIERQAIVNLSVTSELTSADAAQVLRAMLADLTPATHQALAPLPAHDAPQPADPDPREPPDGPA